MWPGCCRCHGPFSPVIWGCWGAGELVAGRAPGTRQWSSGLCFSGAVSAAPSRPPHGKYETRAIHGCRRAWAAPDREARPQGLWLRTASPPRALRGGALGGCGEGTEAQPACPPWGGLCSGAFWVGVTPVEAAHARPRGTPGPPAHRGMLRAPEATAWPGCFLTGPGLARDRGGHRSAPSPAMHPMPGQPRSAQGLDLPHPVVPIWSLGQGKCSGTR